MNYAKALNDAVTRDLEKSGAPDLLLVLKGEFSERAREDVLNSVGLNFSTHEYRMASDNIPACETYSFKDGLTVFDRLSRLDNLIDPKRNLRIKFMESADQAILYCGAPGLPKVVKYVLEVEPNYKNTHVITAKFDENIERNYGAFLSCETKADSDEGRALLKQLQDNGYRPVIEIRSRYTHGEPVINLVGPDAKAFQKYEKGPIPAFIPEDWYFRSPS